MGQSARVQVLINGVWTQIPVYAEQGPIDVQIGPDPVQGTTPTRISCTLADDARELDPTNPASQYYDKIGLNTQFRASIPVGTFAAWGEVSSWRPDRTPEHVPAQNRGMSWVDVTAEGPLRRIGRWEDPLRSPMYRRILSYQAAGAELLGYFPAEDGPDSTQLSNVITGGTAGATAGDVSYSGATGPGGSSTVVKLGSAPQVTGVWARPTTNLSGWQISWSMKLDTAPPSATDIPLMRWQTTAGHLYTFFANNTNFRVTVSAADGVPITTQTFAQGAGVNTASWITYRIKVTDIGASVQVEPSWYLQDVLLLYGSTFTFTAANPGLLVDWGVVASNAAFGHLYATASVTVDLLNTAALNAFNGYLGETALARWQRLLSETGFTSFYVGDAATSVTMGRQPASATLLDLLDECAITDDAIYYDELNAVALTYQLRSDRYTATPVLALTYPGHIAALGKAVDDVGIVNDVTVVNRTGGSASASLEAGALSVQPPPAGIGRYRKTLDVNMYPQTQLASRAQLELSKGTIRRARYTSVTIDLLANPAFNATQVRPGQLITIAGLEAETVRLLVLRINRVVGAATSSVTFSCLPFDVYDVGVYDAATAVYDSASTTLAAAATSTATSLSLTTALVGDTWPTSGFPYSMTIAGERVTVTGMTAAAGTGPYTQTATVTRSANGVVKAQLINAEVHTSYPDRYA